MNKPYIPQINAYLNKLNQVDFLDLNIYIGEFSTLIFVLSVNAMNKMEIDFIPPLMKECEHFNQYTSDDKLFELFRSLFPSIRPSIEKNFHNVLNEYYIQDEKECLEKMIDSELENKLPSKKLKV
jgi:hypothetical protein